MDAQQALHRAIITFAIIFVSSTIAARIVFAIAGVEYIHAAFPLEMLFMSFLTGCVVFIFYSRDELNDLQIIVRYGLAYVLSLTIAVASSFIWGWFNWSEWNPLIHVALLVVIVAIVFVAAVAADNLYLRKIASDVAAELKRRKG